MQFSFSLFLNEDIGQMRYDSREKWLFEFYLLKLSIPLARLHGILWTILWSHCLFLWVQMRESFTVGEHMNNENV